MTKTVSDWKFADNNVQDGAVYSGADYVSSESCIICAVPWTGSEDMTSKPAVNTYQGRKGVPSIDINTWIPIGLLDNATLLQNKQVAQLFEIGSKRGVSIPGRTFKRLNLTRVFFNGPSLLKAMTMFNAPWTDFKGKGALDFLDEEAIDKPGDITTIATFDASPHLFIDLASHFFDVPANLGIIMKDSEDDAFGAFIMADAVVQSHQMSLTGQQTVIMENVSMTVGDIIPIQTAAAAVGKNLS